MSGTARLSHAGKILTVTTDAKRGKRTVKKTVVYAVEKTIEGTAVYLTKEKGEQYRVTKLGCNCPDRQFRPGQDCKHLLAARAVGLIPKE